MKPHPINKLMLKYGVKEKEIVIQALTHSSYDYDNNNERLEFLGDSVLNLVIAQTLMRYFPEASEKELTQFRSSLVCNSTLAMIANDLKIGELIRIKNRHDLSDSVLADAFEALIGAFYLTVGFNKVVLFLHDIYEPRLHKLDKCTPKLFSPKTELQEKTQKLYKIAPTYDLIDSSGPEHAKLFKVEVLLAGSPIGIGQGKSKKEAEQRAAFNALRGRLL